jgi:2'-5' RNA ligase
MRSFVAIRPPARALAHLDVALRAVRSASAVAAFDESALRWAPEENWHLTLAFFGEVPDGRVEELTAAVRDAAVGGRPFSIRLRGAGVFTQRTLWVGASGGLDELRDLSGALREAGEAAGGRRDDRVRSRPHLTVGRVRPGGAGGAGRGRRPRGGGRGDESTAGLVRALAVYEGPEWVVDSVLLTESRPGEGRGGGPLYVDRTVLPIGPG